MGKGKFSGLECYNVKTALELRRECSVKIAKFRRVECYVKIVL